MAELTLIGLHKSYGKIEVLHDINLGIEPGEFIVFVGPSGCGKSTLLRMIAGLEEISGGELQINGQRVNDIPPSQRGIAMVFQTYALYPHMTVYDNMAFSMRIARKSKSEIDRRVREAATILQLGDYLSRLPKALSGGQRQRVAIGRAIVRNPKVFLFDEPLSNLDAALRVATRIEIANLKESMPDTTMIYVTHDQVEAMTLADRIVVLSAGRIEQVGSPLELYAKPDNLFVARFIGSPAMNILPVRIAATKGESVGVVMDDDKTIEIPLTIAEPKQGSSVQLGVRPEHLRMANGAAGDRWLLEGEIAFVESLGEVTQLYLKAAADGEPVVAKIPGVVALNRGDRIRLAADPAQLHLFDSAGLRLG